jgi:hypothetical protein
MMNEYRTKAWPRRCSQLEALGVDTYAPQVPTDDSRYPQVQAILNEYKVAIGDIVPVPPGWEGKPPLRAIKSLADLDDFLMDQWDSTVAIEMGGVAYTALAMDQAARAVRNGYRVLAWLGVEDRPERPYPVESLAIAKLQLGSLERWVRQKVKDGWTPREASQPEIAAASPAKTEKRPKPIDDHDANSRLKQYLDRTPMHKVRIKEAKKAVGLSQGKVCQLSEWKHHMVRRNAAKPPPKIKEIQMRKKIQESDLEKNDAEKEDNIGDVIDRMDRRAIIWREIIEDAEPNERPGLFAKSMKDREAMIDMREEHLADLKEQKDRYRWSGRNGS